MAGLRDRFDHARDLTVAAEEELLLLDPSTMELRPTAPALLEQLGAPDRYRAELSPAQVEIVSDVCSSSGEVREQLAERRRRVRDAAGGRLRLAGVGAHPFAPPWSDIGSAPRHKRLLAEHQLGARLGALAAGLHVHVGVTGAARALAVYNHLRGLMPPVIALAANAPFFGSRDTGLATVRCTLANALPRHGTGPPLPEWSAFEDLLAWGAETGAVPDPSMYWWDCRLNTRTGTVEVRAPDAQASLDDVEALVWLVHAAAREACRIHDGGGPMPLTDTAVIEENRWRAARYGMDARLVDVSTMRMAPVRDVLAQLLDRLADQAAQCGESRALAHARVMLDGDAPGEQRRIARSSGLPALCTMLADRTEAV